MDDPTATTPPPPTWRGRQAVARPTPDQLLRQAVALRALLLDLDADEHAMRSRLLLARDDLRREAAAQWRERGWRPVTESR